MSKPIRVSVRRWTTADGTSHREIATTLHDDPATLDPEDLARYRAALRGAGDAFTGNAAPWHAFQMGGGRSSEIHRAGATWPPDRPCDQGAPGDPLEHPRRPHR